MTYRNDDRLCLILRAFLDWAEVLAGSVFAVIFIFTFVINTVSVSGDSMEYTLFDGDRLITRSMMYTPKMGDIVVIQSDTLDEYIVKRVIAIAGQTVTVDYIAGTVSVDGDIIYEPYIRDGLLDDTGNFDIAYYDSERQVYEYRVPENSVFVMGDNRDRSTDSRSFGAVSFGDVAGKVIFRISSEHGHIGPVG